MLWVARLEHMITHTVSPLTSGKEKRSMVCWCQPDHLGRGRKMAESTYPSVGLQSSRFFFLKFWILIFFRSFFFFNFKSNKRQKTDQTRICNLPSHATLRCILSIFFFFLTQKEILISFMNFSRHNSGGKVPAQKSVDAFLPHLQTEPYDMAILKILSFLFQVLQSFQNLYKEPQGGRGLCWGLFSITSGPQPTHDTSQPKCSSGMLWEYLLVSIYQFAKIVKQEMACI